MGYVITKNNGFAGDSVKNHTINKKTRLFAAFLSAFLLCSFSACTPGGSSSGAAPSGGGENSVKADSVVSRVVTSESGRTYIEHNGKPYLFYGTQLRIDNIRERYSDDISLIDTMFAKVKEDGFNTIVVPIKWYQIEAKKDQFNFDLMELYYQAVYKYDLTVQWLWFGTEVCGSGGCTPNYLKESDEYVKWKSPEGLYYDFTCEATLEREKNALARLMDYIAERDTERRCVMIQIDNEVSHGGPVFDGGTDTWYKTEEAYFKYGWAGGQHYAIADYLNKLGDVIHSSKYNCVTRVNIMKDAWEVGRDISDVLLKGSGVDIIGIDVYETTWYENLDNIFINEGNVFHFAEASTEYDHSYTVVKFLAEGYGFLSYSYNNYQSDIEKDGYGGGYYYVTDEDLFTVNPLSGNSIEAVKKFNYTVNKCKDVLAEAVANSCVAAFNYQQEDEDVSVTRAFGDYEVTYVAKEKGYGMAFWLTEKEFVCMTGEDGSAFAFGKNKVEKAEYGEFVNGEWKTEDGTPTVKGNRVITDGYKLVKVTLE